MGRGKKEACPPPVWTFTTMVLTLFCPMNTQKKLKAALIGTGHFGRFHTRHLSQHADWECAGVYDKDAARAEQIAQEFSVPVNADPEALMDTCDALFITCPTDYHYEYARQALLKRKHVFIEKPITTTQNEARELLQLAQLHNVKIQVGHVERFNPALMALEGLNIQPRFIEAHRLVGFVPRGINNPVVHENMIHDIDIILSLVRSPVKDIQAQGTAVISNLADIVNARLTFENGCVANVTASRISLNPMRKMRLFQKEHYITIDFQLGSTEMYRVAENDGDLSGDKIIPMEGSDKSIIYSKKSLQDVDAMYAEQAAFAKAIRDNSTPVVSGEDGLEALKLADRINQLLLEL